MAILQVKHKDFFWIKPKECPSCDYPILWGHGFVYRYFHCYPEALPLKRYRCPNCGAVHTMRPAGYSQGFSVLRSDQFRSIKKKLFTGRWLKSHSRQIQQYWYKGFLKQLARSGLNLNPADYLESSAKSRYPIATHSIKTNVTFHP